MIDCTVHAPLAKAGTPAAGPDALVFLRDGFSWPAFLFAPVWMLLHQLWLPLLGYLVVAIGIDRLAAFTGLGPRWPILVALGLNVLVGFEGNNLRRWVLERKGYEPVGSITGTSTVDCERRFLESWTGARKAAEPAPALPPAAPAAAHTADGWQRVQAALAELKR